MAELSGFEVLGLLNEVGAALRGTYINNIHRLGGSQLFRFRKPEAEDLWLVVSPKRGVWLSRSVKERTETTEFTTQLRSELERSRFVGASQVGLDRIFELEFEGKEKRTLIVELMPPGNVVVTDAAGGIRTALHEVRTPARRVTKGSVYRPPAQTRLSPAGLREEDVAAMLKEEKTAGSAIGRHVALPRKYVSECLARLRLTDGSPSSDLEGRGSEVVRTLTEMVKEARERPRPCICETPRGDEIFVFPPTGLNVKDSAETLSELCDRLFLQEAQAEPVAESPQETRRKEMEVTISRLRAESSSRLAEASKLRAAAARARSSTIEEATRILRDSGVRSSREPGSPASVSSLLFDQAKKLELKSAEAVEAADKLEKKVPRARPRGPRQTRPLSVRKQEWYERFRWFFTSRGKLAVGGRDAQTNSTLISRHLEDADTVYHADLFGSPFFILKGGREQEDEEVRQVAQATVAFSSAWKTGLGSADAYWVRPEQVRTAAPSGEYLQRGSFAITGKKNFVPKILVEIAIGVDGEGRAVAGPEDAIRGRASPYLVLRPQREKGSDTAKRVLRDLTGTGSGPRPTLDEVLRTLPTGGGKVARRSEDRTAPGP
ncbi:MAG: NFACT family protein [Nitrososphaerota archaeon]|nr:NFACT family protein [Nitrososphaerota archaeon]MDG7024494.1 NFACT family protein [Nitrososphaerota archaeon]